jgi:catechol 2,3-dioxygenase-like lactoylglutathione lyase family enzyme
MQPAHPFYTPAVAPPRLFRVIVPVTDIDAAAGWYGAALGMAGSRVPPNRHYFDCGGTILALRDVTLDPTVGVFRPNPDHVYLSVYDIVAAHERMRLAGCPALSAIEVQPWGERSFYGRDPDGNPLCVVEAGTEFTAG